MCKRYYPFIRFLGWIKMTTFFERIEALADPLRGRILRTLEDREMTVSELCAVFQLPQSTMSRQLKSLSDDGWVASRPEGTSRWYRMAPGELPVEARQLWQLVREEVVALAATERDTERVKSVLNARRSRSQAFFSTEIAEWDRHRSELVGKRL